MSGFDASTHGVVLDAMEGRANGQRVALFLDLDGTLCPFCVDPQAVRLSAGQHCVLERLYDLLDGALCVLSGRSLQDLGRIFDGMRLGLIGGHGAEGLTALGSSEDQRQLLHAEQAMLKLSDPDAGIWIERKPHACALHYRANPDRGPELGARMRELVAPLFALRLLEGDCVYEVLPSGVGKGRALRRAMTIPPFRNRVPVVLGDDVSDEDAFAAATALGGFGIAVGPRTSQTASFRLRDVEQANLWLTDLVRQSGVLTRDFSDA